MRSGEGHVTAHVADAPYAVKKESHRVAVQESATKMFEAKPRRAVGFSEVKMAVVPEGTDVELINALQGHGIEVRTYPKGDNEARIRIVDEGSKEMDIQFQILGEKGAKGLDKSDGGEGLMTGGVEAERVEPVQFEIRGGLERGSGIGDKEIENIIVDEAFAPKTRKEAIEMLDRMEQPFLNEDQGVEIYVSHGDAHHTMSFRNIDQIKIVGSVGEIIKKAVKIGNEPVAEDEKKTTKSVTIYYCPINVNGVQYSGRMVVKEYFRGTHVVDEIHLYNIGLRKEKHPSNTLSQDGTPNMRSDAKSAYKVIELIHNSQEKDKNSFDSYKYYVVGLKIDGVDYTAKLAIGVKNGETYYDHSLTEINKNGLLEAIDPIESGFDSKEVSGVKDKRLISLLQINNAENAKKIKQATGWERGADGEWRYEVGETEDIPRGEQIDSSGNGGEKYSVFGDGDKMMDKPTPPVRGEGEGQEVSEAFDRQLEQHSKEMATENSDFLRIISNM